MSLLKELQIRSESKCELCGTEAAEKIYALPPDNMEHTDQAILICETCNNQILNPDQMDPNHWRCLNEAMWSEVPAVQVMSFRMLHRIKSEEWPNDLLEMLYFDEETLAWAQGAGDGVAEEDTIIHKDSHGAILEAGDTVTLIKDLNVKGANFVAKRGTAVRNIRLVHDNPGHIEGKVSGQQIVILTEFVKKQSKSQ